MTRDLYREALPDQDLLDDFIARVERRLRFLSRAGASTTEQEEVRRLEHIRFVLWVAHRQLGPGIRAGLTIMDLVQEGYTGLLAAFQTFDATQGAFTTHAHWQIRSPITRALRNSVVEHGLRLPNDRLQDLRNLRTTISTLIGKLTRMPRDVEIVKELERHEMATEDAWRLIHLFSTRMTRSLPSSNNEEGEEEDIPERVIADSNASPDSDTASHVMMRKLVGMIHTLPDLEQDILKHRFCLFGASFMTHKELAEKHACSESRIRERKAKALGTLRLRLWSEDLDLLALLPRDGASTAR